MIKLICDLDSVCANFQLAFTKLIKENINPEAPIISGKDIKDWDWTTWYPISKAELDKAWALIKKTENFWLTLPIIDRNGLIRLSNLKNQLDIYFMTNRVDTAGFSAMRQSQIWLEERGFFSPNVIVTDDKHEVAKLLGNVKYFIDDKPSYYTNAKLTGTDYKVLGIIDYEYNKKIESPHVMRFETLSDFVRAVEETL